MSWINIAERRRRSFVIASACACRIPPDIGAEEQRRAGSGNCELSGERSTTGLAAMRRRLQYPLRIPTAVEHGLSETRLPASSVSRIASYRA